MERERLVKLGVAVDVDAVALGEFEIVAMRAGEANGLVYTAAVLERAVRLFEGLTVFCNHPSAMDLSRAGGRRVEDIAGVVMSTWYEANQRDSEEANSEGCIRGVLVTGGPKGEMVKALAGQIVADREAGLAVPNVGLSADMYVRVGRDGKTVEEIRRVLSLDVVFNPAAGGSFERVLNSVNGRMSELANERGGYAGMDEQVLSGEGKEKREERMETQDKQVVGESGGESLRATLASLQAAREQAERAAQEQLRLSCRSLLDTALQASTLPAPLKTELREQFEGRIFQAEELSGALQKKEEVYAKLVESAVIKGMGYQGPVIRGMKDSLDRVQAAANMLLGAPVADELKDTPRLSGLRELYIMLTGDYDFHGVFHPERVQLANVNTATMTSVVKNAMNVLMLEAFNMNPRWWAPIAHEEDFATMDDITWVTTGGFGDLPTVAEGAAYTELTWADNEETSAFVKKGGYVGITLEMIDKDRVSAVRAIPRKLGLAAYRTVSSLVSALFTANAGVGPTLSDTGALFNATETSTPGGHKNLLTDALSLDAWDAVVQAMYKQPEQNSGKPLGVRPAYCLVPIELEKTALTIFGSPQVPGTADNDINPRTMSADRVITVPEWTDANNWAAAADPAQLQGVCIGYRFGRVPELFVADDGLTGSMFTNDEMRIKGRFVVAVGIGDWRALHKSNVA